MLAAPFRFAVAAAVCSISLTHAHAGELVGKPIKVNPPSDAAGSVLSAFVTIDRKGGFGAVWGKDTNGVAGQDALFARFYDKKGKAVGKAIRYDVKTSSKTPRAVYFQQPMLLGNSTVFQPWNVYYTDDTASPVLARLFKKGKALDGFETISTYNYYSQYSSQLRDGRGILTIPGQGSAKYVGQFIEQDGSAGAEIPFPEPDFYGEPQSLKTGFIRSRFEDGEGTLIFYLSAKIYNADGELISGEIRLTPDFPYSDIRGTSVIGLETGNLFVSHSHCTSVQQDARCEVTGQLFTSKGDPIGKSKTLLKDVSNTFAFSTYLPDGGFLISTRELTASGAKITYYRFDETMKAKGQVVEKRPAGDRADLPPQLMTDGRIVTGYLLDRKTVVLQVIEP